MDYEKLHKDTIAKLQEMVNSGKITVETACGICADFVPESEDERIRKEIINYFKCQSMDEPSRKDIHNKWLAWLEKQAEHANFRNKIQIGDKVTRNEDGVLVNLSQLKRVAKKDDKQGEQKPVVNDNAKEMFIKALERVEEQNAKGYKLTDCDKNSWWEDFKNYTSCTIEQKPTGWSEKLIADVFEMVGLAKIVREQENDALTRALQSAMIELAKYSVVPQIRQEWSEEDEKQARQIERIVHNDGCTQKLQEQIANWFKSIKERCNWKPSDEQMAALKDALNDAIWQYDYKCSLIKEEVTRKHAETIEYLYNDLKKLK